MNTRYYTLVQHIGQPGSVDYQKHYCASLELGNGYPRLRCFGYSLFDVVVDQTLYTQRILGRNPKTQVTQAAEILQSWRKLVNFKHSEFQLEKDHDEPADNGGWYEFHDWTMKHD